MVHGEFSEQYVRLESGRVESILKTKAESIRIAKRLRIALRNSRSSHNGLIGKTEIEDKASSSLIVYLTHLLSN